jgi:hypothetical protein
MMTGSPFREGNEEIDGVDQDNNHQAKNEHQERIAQRLWEPKLA